MRLATAALLALAVAASAAAPAAAQPVLDGRRCATPEPTVAERIALDRLAASFAPRTAALVADDGPVTVPVAVHVISAGPGVAQGEVPQARIEAQIDTLNTAFARFGLRFALALVNRVENPDWYLGMRLGSDAEAEMKAALALDPARVLNLYTVRPAGDFLGWASLPDGDSETDVIQGVVVLDQSLPGGAAAPFDLGHTGTHEVGHWAGLLHTFAGGCSVPGDGVADTPQQRSGTRGCPPARDSCPLDPGADPVHNYMDYSDDACMTGFTGGQRDRSLALLAPFRPTLTAGGFALATVPGAAFQRSFVGVDGPAVLRVTNATAAPFTVTGVAASGGLSASVAGLPVTVAPGGVAALALAVRPAEPGPFAGTVTVTTTSASAPTATVEVSGTATRPPTARLGTAGLAVRLVEGETATREVVLANDGDGPLAFSVDPDRLPPGVAAVSPASGVVAPESAVTLTVALTSAAVAPGAYAAAVTVETNDPVRGDVVVAVDLQVLARPTALAVRPAYPNPTRGRVTIPLELADDATVRADAYDARGRRVAVVAEATALGYGFPELVWDTSGVPAGVYFVRVTTGEQSAVARVVVVR